MRKKLPFILSVLAFAGMTACDEDSSRKDLPQNEELCGDVICDNGEKCVDDVCTKPGDAELCGGMECDEGEKCVDDVCTKPGDAESCGGMECDEGEECVQNRCQARVVYCGTEICGENEVCVEGICFEYIPDKCGEIFCAADEVCDDDKCVPNDGCAGSCKEGEFCDDGVCVSEEPDPDPEPDPEPAIPAKILVEPTSGLVTTRTGGKAEFSVVLNQAPQSAVTIPIKSLNSDLGSVNPAMLTFTKENWDVEQSVAVTGTTNATVSKESYQIQVGPAEGDEAFKALDIINVSVTHKDDAPKGKCSGKESKDDAGQCITVPVKSIHLNSSYKLLLGESVSIKVKFEPADASNQDIEWKFENITVDKSDEAKEIIRYNLDNEPVKTIKPKILGARDIKVMARSKSNKNAYAETVLHLRPYYKLVDYDYTFGGTNPKRDNVYGTNKKTGTIIRDLSCKYFGANGAHVLNHDLYTDYVRPKMILHNKIYYGTRASVVAAARFLTMQFPFDIPYYMGDDPLSHYSWADKTKYSRYCEGRIYGFNLRPQAYNNYNDDVKDANGAPIYKSCEDKNGGYITTPRTDSVPWGCVTQNKSGENIRVGLECSGFVTWALRNGRMNLGDWRNMFHKADDFCQYSGSEYRNKTTRLYELPDSATHLCCSNEPCKTDPVSGKCDATDCKSKGIKYKNVSLAYAKNPNNGLDKVHDKFARFNPNTDIWNVDAGNVPHKGDIKAGDIIMHPKYCKKYENGKELDVCLGPNAFCQSDSYYAANKIEQKAKLKSGHIAMIIAIKWGEGKNAEPKEIYVGEASSIGNQVSRYVTDSTGTAWNKLVNSNPWGKKKGGTRCYNSHIYKMDHVYDYYSKKYNLEVSGNTYQFSDWWN